MAGGSIIAAVDRGGLGRNELELGVGDCAILVFEVADGVLLKIERDVQIEKADLAPVAPHQTTVAKPQPAPKADHDVAALKSRLNALDKRKRGGEEQYTAYTSRDGTTWVRGSTWTHNLGGNARIALLSLGGSGFTASFDYVRVYGVRREGERDDDQDGDVLQEEPQGESQ